MGGEAVAVTDPCHWPACMPPGWPGGALPTIGQQRVCGCDGRPETGCEPAWPPPRAVDDLPDIDRYEEIMPDPYAFPRFHWRSVRKVAPHIARSLRHPTRDAFRGLNTAGSIAHTIWWWCSDVGWSRLWRPLCWARGYHVPHHCDVYFERCAVCDRLLWSKRRDGMPNPFLNPTVDRARIGGRR